MQDHLRILGESPLARIERQLENAKRAIYRQAYIECCAEVGVSPEPIPAQLREIVMNCHGTCPCPTCGGPAYWSPVFKLHGCTDPDCGTVFPVHSAQIPASPVSVGSRS